MRQQILDDLKSGFDADIGIREFCEIREKYTPGKIIYRFGTWTNAKVEAGIMDSNKCPSCGVYTSRLSPHWKSCEEPELSDYIVDTITGCVISDGTVSKDGSIYIYSSNKEFLEWLSGELGFMCYDIYMNDSGDDRHRRNIKNGFDVERDANYKDMYRVGLPRHSSLTHMKDWYINGEKMINNAKLSEDVIRTWYCGDGGLCWQDNNRAYAEIRPVSLSEYDDKIKDMFDDVDLNPKVSSGNIRFYGDTDRFLDIIGPAPKGMEYKWENKDRERYNRLK